nr:glutamate receptor ionotropic, NMDA 2B-like [Penaeus vannamei]
MRWITYLKGEPEVWTLRVPPIYCPRDGLYCSPNVCRLRACNSCSQSYASMSGLRIQMAPSIHHQAAAMLSILVRYQWHAFTIVTSHIAGHADFVQTVRDQVHQYEDPHDISKPKIKFTIIDTVLVNRAEDDLGVIADSEARIMLLYSTRMEAASIMRAAERLGLTGKNYVWIVTQSVVGPDIHAPSAFPVGMLDLNPQSYREPRMVPVHSSEPTEDNNLSHNNTTLL